MRAVAENVSIRAARPADLQQLSQIWLELMRFHEETDDRFALAEDGDARWRQLAQEILYRDDGFLLVAELTGRTVGFVLGWVARNPPIYRTSDVGFVSEIAVTAWARRKGIGRALVEAARDWFGRHGLEEFQLSTAVWNDTARRFWEAIGGEQLLVRYRFVVPPQGSENGS
jgi:ribosomal protein S18 acetylase RimI-like enzyme